MQLRAIIFDSLRESLDRKIFWVLVGMTGAVALAMLSISFEGDRVSYAFGLWSMRSAEFDPLTETGSGRLVGLVVYGLLSMLLGWIGIILMIIATAGSLPAMMQPGAVDILLSKPISRPRLFLYKYVANMAFVLVQAALFVVVTFVVMGLRWRVWCPAYLLSIPLVVLLFSYLYCVSALVAVTTGSTVAAILISIAAWVVFALVHQAPLVIEQFPALKERTFLYHSVRAVSWIPPKTGDFEYLAAKWSGTDPILTLLPAPGGRPEEEDDWRRARALEAEQVERTNAVTSIGSSLAFEAVLILVAIWRFCRRDF